MDRVDFLKDLDILALIFEAVLALDGEVLAPEFLLLVLPLIVMGLL